MTEYFRRFERNTAGKDYLITDNHGCWDEVEELLEKIHFNPEVDRLFHIGDMVDRGPQSHKVLEWLDKPWFYPVAGNHEHLAIRMASRMSSPHRYVMNGGAWFLDLSQELKERIALVFLKLPLVMEIDTPHGPVGLVHAEPYETWAKTVEKATSYGSLSSTTQQHYITKHLLWCRQRHDEEIRTVVPGIDRIYVGHTPDNKIRVYGNVHYIDTGLVFGGKLTCINLTDNTVIEVKAKKIYWPSDLYRFWDDDSDIAKAIEGLLLRLHCPRVGMPVSNMVRAHFALSYLATGRMVADEYFLKEGGKEFTNNTYMQRRHIRRYRKLAQAIAAKSSLVALPG